MKREALLKVLKKQGCIFLKHGGSHDHWQNPNTGAIECIPRHKDIHEFLAKAIIKKLS
jgi:predicted RNA binding protein YcfA (HicA-like mRNA interferase family)